MHSLRGSPGVTLITTHPISRDDELGSDRSSNNHPLARLPLSALVQTDVLLAYLLLRY
jgi:hypothetical protein